MPKFRKVSPEEIEELTSRRQTMQDLGEYLAYLGTLNPGDWGSIDLAPDETQRTIKRRTSVAAKNLGKRIRWRNSGQAGRLFFRVMPSNGS